MQLKQEPFNPILPTKVALGVPSFMLALLIGPNIATSMPSMWILHSVTVFQLVDFDTYLSWSTEPGATIGRLASRTFPLTASFQPLASFMLWQVCWHAAFILIMI
jgi:hypothetical protein